MVNVNHTRRLDGLPVRLLSCRETNWPWHIYGTDGIT